MPQTAISPVPSESSSSVHSTDLRPTVSSSPAPNLAHLNVNGNATPPKKPTITHRLTRMFSQTGRNGSREGELLKEPPRDRPATHNNNNNNNNNSSDTDVSVGSKSRQKSVPSRQNSYSEKKPAAPAEMERKPSSAGGGGGGGSAKGPDHASAPAYRRFELLPDGLHQHHLKSAKRQEKLSDMLLDLISGKKKEEQPQQHPHGDEQQLSLVSNWVDQLKHERDKMATDKKGGPNATVSLVQKYGKCQEIIGRGAFGIVRISHKTDPHDSKMEQLYAVKEFRRRPQESPKKYQKRLTSEFCISSSLRHPNVIHTLDLLQDAKGDYCEVMEFCAGGDLYTLVLAAGKLEVTEADCYFEQLMRGVEYMHEMGVAHRDLKPENLLLTTHGSLKITDFGNGECFRMAWEKEAHMTGGLCGSAPYIAPEEYTDPEFDARAVDVWATGVIYMAMRTGRHLWRIAKKDEDEFFEKYLEGRRDEGGYSPIETLHRARCRNVIYSILDPNPTRRITASQVLKSEWGREIKLCKAGEEGF
ncbi:MAG: serine/threonine-protein kinase HAL4/sat4 [Sclerophora amabilis]|nr:MAG: serine/threonine-protein kinase HAL4/sat4 [Sclerophora amabilis]